MSKNKNDKLVRTLMCELRAEENAGAAIITGRPIVFNSETVVGGMWREVIRNGALDGADLSDVCLLVNHEDDRIPLARSRASKKTMDLSIDSEGLVFRAELDVENNSDARAVYSAIKRGDVYGMSFAFRVAMDGDMWEDNPVGLPLRTIIAIDVVHEISVVNRPAYPDTFVAVRSEREHLDAIREQMEQRKGAEALELAKAKALAMYGLY